MIRPRRHRDRGMLRVVAGAIGQALLICSALPAMAAGPGSANYTYDNAGRLRGVTYEDGTTVTYGLDAAGNRTVVTTALDTAAPSVPTGLTASTVSATQVTLSWSASTDTGGADVAGYRVFRDGSLLTPTIVATTGYVDATVASTTTYGYTVRAYDNAGNASADSTVLSVTMEK